MKKKNISNEIKKDEFKKKEKPIPAPEWLKKAMEEAYIINSRPGAKTYSLEEFEKIMEESIQL